jgi:hypothetical protein
VHPSDMKRDLEADVNRFGGLARTSQLKALGTSARAISEAVKRGQFQVPRRGWVAGSSAPANAVRAVELGGVLGGWSALHSYGVWADGDGLVISTTPTASRLPALSARDRRVWLRPGFPVSGVAWRVSVRDALLQHACMVLRPSLIASIDSALNSRRMTPAEYERFVDALPERLRSIRKQVDARSMSGTESKLRIACVEAGFLVELQASIAGVGFVDLLIDGWLIVEVDSRQFHDVPIQQHVDRVRDGNAVLGQFGNLRFDYQLVQFDLAWCVDVIRARLSSGAPSARSTG